MPKVTVDGVELEVPQGAGCDRRWIYASRVLLAGASLYGIGFCTPATAIAEPNREAVESYAACLAQRHYREVGKALDSGFNAEFVAAVAAIPTSGCDVAGLSGATATQLRGPLFAAMYRRFGPAAGRSASNILSQTGWMPKLPAGDPRSGWYAVSNCLVGHAPDAARRLVQAKSVDESRTQMQKLIGALPGCLPNGQQFKINAVVLADLIAETVYEIDFATQYGEAKRPWGGL